MKIGILLPSSKLYPSLMIDFIAGVRFALEEANLEKDIEFVIDSIDNGTAKATIINALNKMVVQHGVDVNLLFTNVMHLDEIIPANAALERPLLITNMGGNIPSTYEGSDYVMTNSFSLWESAYKAAEYGVQHYGKKVAHATYYYEAGYRMYESFCLGLSKAGGEIVFNQVSELNPDPNDFTTFMEALELEQPDFLYTLYSERDAVNFMNQLIEHPNNGRFPIITSGVMLNDEILEKLAGIPRKIENVVTWDASLKTPENIKFILAYAAHSGRKANYFSLLGYECLGSICEAYKSKAWSKNGLEQAKAIRASKFSGPRGLVNYENDENMSSFEQHVFELNNEGTRVLSSSIGYFEQRTAVIAQNKLTAARGGWYQPYLCQ